MYNREWRVKHGKKRRTISKLCKRQKKALCVENDTISDSLFQEYGVNRGLRDINGKGVLTGLTNISKIVSFKEDENGKTVPCDGELWYRGYNVKTLINSIGKDEFGFEDATYLLLFGELPDKQELKEFCQVLGESRTLPTNFTRDVIMKAPSKDIMNSMTRSILTLALYDPTPVYRRLRTISVSLFS